MGTGTEWGRTGDDANHSLSTIKVKSAANPFDPAWESYFEQRLDRKMVNHLEGNQSLRNLWFEQQGICPVCDTVGEFI